MSMLTTIKENASPYTIVQPYLPGGTYMHAYLVHNSIYLLKRRLDLFSRFCTTNAALSLYHHIAPPHSSKFPITLGGPGPYLMHSALDPPDARFQLISRPSQPFFHNTGGRARYQRTDRQTSRTNRKTDKHQQSAFVFADNATQPKNGSLSATSTATASPTRTTCCGHPREDPRSIVVRHVRHARFSRDMLATSSRGCHGDATRKLLPWNLSLNVFSELVGRRGSTPGDGGVGGGHVVVVSAAVSGGGGALRERDDAVVGPP